jgi:hypothetical protein
MRKCRSFAGAEARDVVGSAARPQTAPPIGIAACAASISATNYRGARTGSVNDLGAVSAPSAQGNRTATAGCGGGRVSVRVVRSRTIRPSSPRGAGPQRRVKPLLELRVVEPAVDGRHAQLPRHLFAGPHPTPVGLVLPHALDLFS